MLHLATLSSASCGCFGHVRLLLLLLLQWSAWQRELLGHLRWRNRQLKNFFVDAI
jgi:hypothetical protein